jgi:hypothetical protein
MPRLSALSVRIALLYLAVGFSLGMVLLFHKGIPLGAWVWRLLPAHIEFLLLGWTLHLVFGVAFWILPRFSREPKRGNESLAWTALCLLNLGIWLVGVVPLFVQVPALTLLGRIAEAGAAASFALHAWPRVKPVGT